jgi:hypothetical protein
LTLALGFAAITAMIGLLVVQQIRWSSMLDHYSRGVVALEAGNLEEAVAELQWAGDYPGAPELARKAAENLRRAQGAYSEALKHIAREEWWDAARALAAVVSVEPRFKDAAALLSRSRARIGYMVVAKPFDPHLYIAHTDGLDLRQVPTDLRWLTPLGLSMDGTTLLASDVTGSRFYLVDTLTGRTESVFSATVPHQARLSPDGSAVVTYPCINTFFALHPGRLSIVRRDGRVADLLEGGECTSAAFAPRGGLLVYAVNRSYSRDKGYTAQLHAYSMDGGTQRPLVSLEEWVVDMRFVGLDALLLLTYREDGFRLLRLDLSTGARQVLATSARSFDGVLSPRGDVLVYRRLSEMGPSTYHVIELPSGREVYAFRCCGTVYQLPAFTADGSRILYIQPSNRAEGQVLYAVKLDGSDPVVVLEAVNQFLISYPDFALD